MESTFEIEACVLHALLFTSSMYVRIVVEGNFKAVLAPFAVPNIGLKLIIS
jgi:hypothetical protein